MVSELSGKYNLRQYQAAVLILVLVEDGLGVCRPYGGRGLLHNVLILVLVEDGLGVALKCIINLLKLQS